MKINPPTALYCYRDEGNSFSMVSAGLKFDNEDCADKKANKRISRLHQHQEPYKAQEGEVLFEVKPTDQELDEAFPGRFDPREAQKQIDDLELEVTNRRVREALAGNKDSLAYIAKIDAQIRGIRDKSRLRPRDTSPLPKVR